MNDVILGAFMITGPLPEGIDSAKSKLGKAMATLRAADMIEYVRPWHVSIHRHFGLRGVLLHDGLPEEVIAVLTTEQVACERIDVAVPCHLYHKRFYAALAWLQSHHEINRVFMTDTNDVAFMSDPFAWWDRLELAPDALLVGEEWNTFDSFWWKRQLAYLPTHYTEMWLRCQHTLPLTCGTWGARRELALELLTAFTGELRASLQPDAASGRWPPITSEMWSWNFVLERADFRERIHTFKLEHGRGPVQHDRSSALRLLGLA